MSDTTVMEAFQSMKLLEDAETFKPVSKDDMSDLSYFLDNDENVDEVAVIDTKAKDKDDLQDSYEGKVILQCPVCKSLIYKDDEEIVVDEDEDRDKKLVNVSEECPYCHTQSGFVIVGKVVPFSETDIEVKDNEDDKDDDEDKEDKRVSGSDDEDDEDDEKNEGFLRNRPTAKAFRGGESYRRNRTRNMTERLARRARVNESIARRDVPSRRTAKRLQEKVFELPSMGDRKSFYGKAQINDNEDGARVLYSYGTPVARIKGGRYEEIPAELGGSMTTKRHENAFKKFYADEINESISSRRTPRLESRVNRNVPKRTSRTALRESDYVDYKRRYDAKDVAKFNRMSQKLRHDPTELGRVLEKYATEIWTPIREPENFKNANDVIEFWQDIFAKEGVSDTNGMNKLFRNISAKHDIQAMCDAIFNFWMGATGNAVIKLRTESLKESEVQRHSEIRKRIAQRKALDKKHKNTKDFTNKDALKIKDNGEVEEGLIGDIVDGAKETGKKIVNNLINPVGNMLEGVQSVNVETDSETITVKNKVSESDEMIKPVSEEEVDEIIAPETDADKNIENEDGIGAGGEPIEDTTTEEENPVNAVDVDVDEFDDDSFERKTESYLRKVYENVNGFKVTSHKVRGDKVFVEGLISFASGKEHKTKFVFESKFKVAPNKYILEGMNANIAKNNKAFKITASLKGKKLVTESLNYNYVTKNNGRFTRVSNTK